MNKEQIYDSKISPLMKQIIAISKEHGIAMMASFAIGHGDGGPNGEDATNLTCNTLLPDENDEQNPLFVAANAHILRAGRPAPLMMTTERGDGSKTMTAFI